jgi:flagellin-specific chaperone FliS
MKVNLLLNKIQTTRKYPLKIILLIHTEVINFFIYKGKTTDKQNKNKFGKKIMLLINILEKLQS